MKIINFPNKDLFSQNEKLFVLGKFINIHKGHQKLFKLAKEYSLKNNLEFCIMIFDDKEDNIFNFQNRVDLISEKYNPDYILKFEPNNKNFSYESSWFENYLLSINTKAIFVGKDYRYGKNRTGDINSLSKNFYVNAIEHVKLKKEKISSSSLNNNLLNEDFKMFKKKTGSFPKLEMKIIKEDINFLYLSFDKLILKKDIYFVTYNNGPKLKLIYFETKNNNKIFKIQIKNISKEDISNKKVYLKFYK